MTPLPLLPLAVLLSSIPAAPAASTRVAPVVEAERSFARAAEAEGIGPAFRRYAAPGAILLAPGPVPAAGPLRHDPPGKLRWWPVYAGMAAAGDLGFTTGPFTLDGERPRVGHFLTIWQKQADGRWLWVLDHGVGTVEASSLDPASSVSPCPKGRPSSSAAAAWTELAAAEAALHRRLAADARGGYAAALPDDGRLMREGPQPAIGRAAFTAALAAGPATLEAAPLGGSVSKAGDLAYTYGSAAWPEAGATMRGYYVRVWQRRASGWVLLIDELTPAPRSAR